MFARLEQLLVSYGAIQQKQIPCYVKWVTNCYAACKVPTTKSYRPTRKNSLLHILENSREERQVKQAVQALRLYTYFFRVTGNTGNAQNRQVMEERSGFRSFKK